MKSQEEQIEVGIKLREITADEQQRIAIKKEILERLPRHNVQLRKRGLPELVFNY